MIHLEILDRSLPLEMDQVRTAAQNEAYRFIDRLVDDWANGTNRFSEQSERLLIARYDGRLVGGGGITIEPALSGALRMRRFYVLPSYRKRGIGRHLVEALLDPAHRAGVAITVNAATDLAPAFWVALGFRPDRRDGRAHILRPTDRLVISGNAVPVIGRETPDQPEIIDLLRQADERSASLYPAESRHGSSVSALLAAEVRFFIVRERGRALGCAGYIVRADGTAEFNRLFIHPSARSRRLAWRLVETIENAAATEGINAYCLKPALNPERRSAYTDPSASTSARHSFLTDPIR